MQGNRKAWPNMLLAKFCKKFRNLLPVSFIIGVKRVSSKNIGSQRLQFIGLGLEFFHQLGITIGCDDLVELGTVI